ncbi:Na+/H+ antiporter NhaA [Acidipropionibacterium virtanenii]|uniref:Na(+)/H(+) antiporter NhaA n=1 Tax=Acidipropionibacterium virtanenii TaxID=2057246 RepID=A0A344UXE0_9ACTN|nr:Na+/H+ antiporter NhaA [Acidipropionibacterium virtanenii]AXE39938.1 Na(+)/H(+) antiporter NhaA [Acidipropionibacterium virtanenii]
MENHPEHQNLQPLRRSIRIHRWLTNDVYAAVALALATVAALVWANVGSSYETFWHSHFGFILGSLDFELTLHEWVDEGIMAIFFFMVGLDVRRDLALGELRSKRRAVLPVAAALGGLIVPAALFLIIEGGAETASAWGTVISTDTAFAVGMLAVVAPRNAPRLRVFLLALAVIDDIAALTVIAVFYTTDLNLLALALAGVGLIGVWLLERANVWRVGPYLMLAIYTWGCFFASGVHATLAGVLIALLMPVYPLRRSDLQTASQVFDLFHQAPQPDMAKRAREALTSTVPMNQRLSSAIAPYVNYLVVPLFALANAGVALSGDALSSAFTSRLTWGIIAGLVAGKAIGITAASMLVLKLSPGSRLPGLDGPRIAGVGALSGMGFTISLLVAGMALDDPTAVDQARVGVIAASLLALGLSWVIFHLSKKFKPLPPPSDAHLARDVDPEADHIRGPVDAPATLVVYASMNYTYRRQTAIAISQTRAALGDQLRVVLRHAADSDNAVTGALALEAAGAQGKFWQMHDEMLGIRGPLDFDLVHDAAERIGLDVGRFERRIERQTDRERVDDDGLDLAGSELSEKPVIYLDGERVSTAANSLTLTLGARKALAGA